MKHVLVVIVLIVATFLCCPFYYQYSPLHNKVSSAIAVIRSTEGNTATGKVIFTQESGGVHVVADCIGLTPGKHAFHIHEFGDCGCPDAECAGGHYNPTAQPHGGPQSVHRHVGDFGNIQANEQGQGHVDFIDTHVQLNGKNSIIGRAVIIHDKEDDFVTQPTGNAGSRIGCGTIGIARNVQTKISV